MYRTPLQLSNSCPKQGKGSSISGHELVKNYLHNSAMEKLHQRLRRLRNQAGLSQASVGEAMGISKNAVSLWETDLEDRRTSPKLSMLPDLANLYRVNLVELLVGDDPEIQEKAAAPDRFETPMEVIASANADELSKAIIAVFPKMPKEDQEKLILGLSALYQP